MREAPYRLYHADSLNSSPTISHNITYIIYYMKLPTAKIHSMWLLPDALYRADSLNVVTT
jgi:hypothetical protein